MKIHQMLPNYWYGDAIGNCATRIRDLLREWGHESDIFADVIHDKLTARPYKEIKEESAAGAWVIYHYSTGSLINNFALDNVENLILIYHNITPAHFFERFDREAAENCKKGRDLLERFTAKTKLAIGVSDYNVMELKSIGFTNTAMAPLILNFKNIEKGGKPPFNDDKTNILFVGRMAPNKKYEDIIKVFYFYRNYVDTNSRLVLVGWSAKEGSYYKSLTRMVEAMNLPDVVFTGAVSDDELGRYYESASLFLCLSRHEGFCAPLIEAMRFNTPVVALASSAVTDTLGYAGVLVNKMEPAKIAELLGVIKEDADLRKKIIETQNRRVEDFNPKITEDQLKNALNQVINKVPA